MKIAIITSRYPSEGNPYNHMFVHVRSKEYINQGEQVEVFVPSNEISDYIFEGVRVRGMPSKEITKFLKEYDVLYLHLLHLYPLMKTDGWPIYNAILKNKYPFAMYVHGSEATYFKDRYFGNRFQLQDLLSLLRKDFYHMPRLKKFLKEIAGKGGLIITPSDWMKDQIKIAFNIDNVYTIPNGIDVGLFSFKLIKSERRIIAVRPLGDKVYDIECTIEVLSFLPEQYTLDIYGKGQYKDDYEKLILSKGLSERIKIIDNFIDRNKMKELFHNYDVFISTTKLDTQGITMLEAMSSGLLVAAINNSSKEEFISDMETGILANRPKELAEKILKVTSSKELFERITKAGRGSMEEIDLKLTCKKELRILKEIASR